MFENNYCIEIIYLTYRTIVGVGGIMQIKIRQMSTDGESRSEAKVEIKEVLINEDIMHPEGESISLCFRGKNTSGILDLKSEELDGIYKAVKKRLHLIKGISKL